MNSLVSKIAAQFQSRRIDEQLVNILSYFALLRKKLNFSFLQEEVYVFQLSQIFLEIQYPLFSPIKMSYESLVYLQY